MYQIVYLENEWIITPSGQFIDRKFFAFEDTSKDYWVYSENILKYMKNSADRPKRMPYLSCFFKTDCVIVSMDDFLENTRCNNIDKLTLPILMAAFSINEKKMHNWYDSDYEAINRDGDKITFTGKSPTLPISDATEPVQT
jgi:hypothetical protein